MSHEQIAVNTDTLRNDITSMKEALSRIETQYKKMYEKIRELDSMWEGKTHDMFMTQVQKDNTDMEEMCNTISQLLECYTFADNEYVRCESQVSSIINAIRL